MFSKSHSPFNRFVNANIQNYLLDMHTRSLNSRGRLEKTANLSPPPPAAAAPIPAWLRNKISFEKKAGYSKDGVEPNPTSMLQFFQLLQVEKLELAAKKSLL